MIVFFFLHFTELLNHFNVVFSAGLRTNNAESRVSGNSFFKWRIETCNLPDRDRWQDRMSWPCGSRTLKPDLGWSCPSQRKNEPGSCPATVGTWWCPVFSLWTRGSVFQCTLVFFILNKSVFFFKSKVSLSLSLSLNLIILKNNTPPNYSISRGI